MAVLSLLQTVWLSLKVLQHAVLLLMHFILRISCAIRFVPPAAIAVISTPSSSTSPLKIPSHQNPIKGISEPKDKRARLPQALAKRARSCHFSKSINHRKPTSRVDSGSPMELSPFSRNRSSSRRKAKSRSDLSCGLSFLERNSVRGVNK